MWFSEENVYSRGAKSPQPTPTQGKESPYRLRNLKKKNRIQKRRDFLKITHEGTRFYGKVLVVDFLPSKFPRLGITTPRSFGNAVKRNRFKRLVREVFRVHFHQISPNDIIVLPKKGNKVLSLGAIEQDLLQFFHESQCTTTKSR